MFAMRPFSYCVYISHNTLDCKHNMKKPRGKQSCYNDHCLIIKMIISIPFVE